MKIESYRQPKSSFLSIEKDMSILVDLIYKNKRLQKLFVRETNHPLEDPALTPEELDSLIGKYIYISPKQKVHPDVRNYMFIRFDNFTPNFNNPEFRDNTISFIILCHQDQWSIGDFQMRPYRIAAEIDSMIDGQHLTGIGRLHFLDAHQVTQNDEFFGLHLIYKAIHGEEDKKFMPNPEDEPAMQDNFNAIFNNKNPNADLMFDDDE